MGKGFLDSLTYPLASKGLEGEWGTNSGHIATIWYGKRTFQPVVISSEGELPVVRLQKAEKFGRCLNFVSLAVSLTEFPMWRPVKATHTRFPSIQTFAFIPNRACR
jgi:hypothetical protein